MGRLNSDVPWNIIRVGEHEQWENTPGNKNVPWLHTCLFVHYYVLFFYVFCTRNRQENNNVLNIVYNWSTLLNNSQIFLYGFPFVFLLYLRLSEYYYSIRPRVVRNKQKSVHITQWDFFFQYQWTKGKFSFKGIYHAQSVPLNFHSKKTHF